MQLTEGKRVTDHRHLGTNGSVESTFVPLAISEQFDSLDPRNTHLKNHLTAQTYCLKHLTLLPSPSSIVTLSLSALTCQHANRQRYAALILESLRCAHLTVEFC